MQIKEMAAPGGHPETRPIENSVEPESNNPRAATQALVNWCQHSRAGDVARACWTSPPLVQAVYGQPLSYDVGEAIIDLVHGADLTLINTGRGVGAGIVALVPLSRLVMAVAR